MIPFRDFYPFYCGFYICHYFLQTKFFKINLTRLLCNLYDFTICKKFTQPFSCSTLLISKENTDGQNINPRLVFAKKETKKETNKKTKTERLNIPDNLWVKCPSCNSTIYSKELKDNLKVCSKCNYHFRISAGERIDLLLDTDSFKEFASSLTATDFLGFFDTKAYCNRIDEATLKSSLNEAIVVGEGLIENNPLSFGVMDFSFMGGSMGSVVGEKFTRMIENSIEHKIPAVVVTASGGARMQEGIMSLMQMAKTSAALGRLRENSLPYISVMTDPTTGGTSASFAM